MNTRIIVRNGEKTSQLEQHVHRELDKLNKFINLNDPLVSLDLVITIEGTTHNLYKIELRVNEPHSKSIAQAEDYDLNAVLAQVIDKMSRELSKVKERALDKRDRPELDDNSLRKAKSDFEK